MRQLKRTNIDDAYLRVELDSGYSLVFQSPDFNFADWPTLNTIQSASTPGDVTPYATHISE